MGVRTLSQIFAREYHCFYSRDLGGGGAAGAAWVDFLGLQMT